MTSRVFRPILARLSIGRRKFHTSAWTKVHKKNLAGFPVIYDKEVDTNKSLTTQMTDGYKMTVSEFKKYKQEFSEDFLFNQHVFDQEDVVNIQWQFKGDESLNEWVCTCDKDYAQGFSTAKLEISQSGTGIFSGVLNTTLPKDGKTTTSGFCNITTTPLMKSFMRQKILDWGFYSHLVMRVRGDGRCYILNINVPGMFDITWDDIRHFLLYTSGGPYWQTVKIPFSKFFYASRGKIQDNGHKFRMVNVSSFGITLADRVNGPFKLEIDYIGVERVSSHFETTAYESYDTSHIPF